MPRLIRPTPLAKALLTLIASLPLLGIASFEALFAPKAEAWPRWEAHVPGSELRVDHDPWDRILQQHLLAGADGIHRFDYARLQRRGLQRLETYLALLGATPVSQLDRDHQLAFWVNLYNALTVHTVTQAYPVESIRDIDISPGFLADGPWGKALISIEGQSLTLNDIEHRIVRPLWGDPRVHYALNCASIGCPNLERRAFRAANLDAMLDTAARNFINSPRGVWWKGGDLAVSSIYAWFQEDFGGDDAGILTHLRRYAEPELARRLAEIRHISYHDYDWRLNDLP
jgi:hypothetical protein